MSVMCARRQPITSLFQPTHQDIHSPTYIHTNTLISALLTHHTRQTLSTTVCIIPLGSSFNLLNATVTAHSDYM